MDDPKGQFLIGVGAFPDSDEKFAREQKKSDEFEAKMRGQAPNMNPKDAQAAVNKMLELPTQPPPKNEAEKKKKPQ